MLVKPPTGMPEEATKEFSKLKPRNDGSMLNQLTSADDKEAYINNFGSRGKNKLTYKQAEVFWTS
jgi:hypothetical protein